jgi:hypothetical protein
MPNLFVLLLHTTDLFPHHHHLILFCDVPLRNFPVIQVHLSIHLHVLICNAHYVLVVLVSLDWNWRVKVEKQVE